jgi:hypothetical protein
VKIVHRDIEQAKWRLWHGRWKGCLIKLAGTKRAIAKLTSKGAAAMSEYLNVIIGYQVESTAEWRRRKAEEFPDDRRNLVAAEELEQLAAQIDRIAESEPVHQQIAKLHDSIKDDDAWMHITEAVSEWWSGHAGHR